ncbi:MAG TPA: hypothetical protein DEP84_09960, partial [Chloroflexi bacterium]|nr:hypothetical protein [Chloroflexota bacterium]
IGTSGPAGTGDPNGRSFFRLAVPPGTGEERVAPEALGIPLPITLGQLARDPLLTARILPQTPGGPELRLIVPGGSRTDAGGAPTGYTLEYRWPDGRLLTLSEQPGPPDGNELPPEFAANPIPVPGAVAGWREEGNALSPLLTALVLYDDGTVVIVLAERLPPDELVGLVQSLTPIGRD